MLEGCYLGFVEFCVLLYLLRKGREEEQRSVKASEADDMDSNPSLSCVIMGKLLPISMTQFSYM